MSSDIDKINGTLVRNRCPQSALSVLTGISSPRLSRILKGGEVLLPQDATLLLDTLDEMDRLAKDVTPRVPIDWSQTLVLKEILAERKRPKVFQVKFGGGSFAGLDSKGKPMAKDEGLVLSGEVAHKLCETLRSMGYDGVRAERVEYREPVVNDFLVAWKQ